MSETVPLLENLLHSMPLPQHDDDDDKEGRGRVLVIGGSREVPGAALLAAIGALRAGAGKLQIATCGSIAPAMGLAIPEAMVVGLPETSAGGIAPAAAEDVLARAEHCAAVVMGPGMMDQSAVDALTAALIAGCRQPALVLDAAALIGLQRQADALQIHDGRVVLTPHAGEMAGLLGLTREDVTNDTVGVAKHAAASLHATVALKGARTVIATPDGRTWSYNGGGIGLATSGSGDTLTGIVAGILARGAAPEVALLWAVYIHGEAGRRLARLHGRVGFLAREILDHIPGIMDGLERGGRSVIAC